MIEKRYSGLKNVKMLVKNFFVKVPTFRLKLQPLLGESDKEFVKKTRSYTMQIGKSELIMFCPLGLNLKIRAANTCHHHGSADSYKCQFPMLLKYVCCANLCLYVKSLKIPRRWCGQRVNNIPLKLTCASVCLQPLFDVLWAGWKIFVSFPRCSFCHDLDRELNKLRHESKLTFRLFWDFWADGKTKIRPWAKTLRLPSGKIGNPFTAVTS